MQVHVVLHNIYEKCILQDQHRAEARVCKFECTNYIDKVFIHSS